MDNDDRQVGTLLSRREALRLVGLGGAALVAGCAPAAIKSTPVAEAPQAPAESPPAVAELPGAAEVPGAAATTASTSGAEGATMPNCIARPEQTEGPYFVDEKLNRSDVRSDPSDGSVREGAPLQLAFKVSQVTDAGCVALAGAMVDIWHCDAEGVYSDARDQGFNSVGKKFLRGYQVTDTDGLARFTTIYPGWYPGRAVHIHFKIRTDPSDARPGQEFTSQLFFDDALSDEVFVQAPYAARGKRNLLNAGDGIFRAGGDQLILNVAKADQGYAATFEIGLQMGA